MYLRSRTLRTRQQLYHVSLLLTDVNTLSIIHNFQPKQLAIEPELPWPVSFAKALGDCEASFSRLPVHPQAGSETRVQMSVVCLCVPRGWCSLENNFAVIQSRRGFTQPPVSVARLVIYIYSRAYVTYPCYKNVLKVYVKLTI